MGAYPTADFYYLRNIKVSMDLWHHPVVDFYLHIKKKKINKFQFWETLNPPNPMVGFQGHTFSGLRVILCH